MSYAYKRYLKMERRKRIKAFIKANFFRFIFLLVAFVVLAISIVIAKRDVKYNVVITKATETTGSNLYQEDKTTSSNPTPSPSPKPRIYRNHKKEDFINYIASKDWDQKTAIAIIYCESSWRETIIGAINPDGTIGNKDGSFDIGLFGINTVHGYSIEELQDGYKNIDVAYELYKKSGWNPWKPSFNRGCVQKQLAKQ